MTGPVTNWAGNVTFRARRIHRPSSLAELRDLVAGSTRVRALGTGHAFNRLADTTGDLISLAGLPPVMDLDPARGTVTVAAGVRYGELATYLHGAGYALHNLASLPHISVAGACATATHGSGDRNGNLATAVAALDLVTAGGDVVTVSRDSDPDRLSGSVVALGALGVVTAVTLDVVPTFDVAQYVYDDLPDDRLRRHWAEIFASGYSVSVFTDWSALRVNQVWLKRRVGDADATAPPERWLGATLADGPRHPVPGLPPVNCTPQLGGPGPWHERLPHFRLDFTPSSGEELQSEFFVPRDLAPAALDAVDGIRDRVAPVLQISEIRTVAADDLWLSPSYRRDSLALHFTWVKDAGAVLPVVAALEERLAPLEARPHWGKIFTIAPEVVRGRYKRMPDFADLRGRHDPAGTFRNDLLDRYLPPVTPGQPGKP
ncbi:D-arabinono-1,4-lactone oxidase [Planosporangium sp. 12N6]|uniref:D-arabinono-1,4-lactone oxidase n=1 Tax=Planosporangium spinosum TaxID=3402278 RepID=UPI003CE9A394